MLMVCVECVIVVIVMLVMMLWSGGVCEVMWRFVLMMVCEDDGGWDDDWFAARKRWKAEVNEMRKVWRCEFDEKSVEKVKVEEVVCVEVVEVKVE